ncbi:MAG TPA: BTAD domain-containing putative transcriptional regulator [Streptosporangiaceae bacterium]|jgi:DNA-binding SARP family transcriptional activator|nr:BTAD domain-containing putative transcriptional regulator [Streptosporangiaceae bacterium]
MNGEIAIRDDEEARGPVTFRLLGAFQIAGTDRPHPVGPGQQQRLLVKLLAAKGMRVANDELMLAIWDELTDLVAPREALHHLVVRVRRTLAVAGLDDVLHNTNGTYRLDVPPAHVDVHVFHALTECARALARDGDQQAVGRLEEALRLCHGEPLAGLPGRWVYGYRHTLAEEIRAAQLALYETALRHGESRERLPGLSTLLRERPDDELVAWLYMHALYRAGQPTRAMEVKTEFSAQLEKTTGAGYGRALNQLCERIQAKDDSLLAQEALAFPGGKAGARARHPGSHDGQDQEREEPHQPPADADGPAPDDPAAGQRPEPAAAGPNLVFNGPVNGQNAVFGTQINYGSAR